jgi:hypothetical protein
MELEVLQNSDSLAALPLREIQQGLAFAGVGVLAGHPGQYFLGQYLVYSKRPTCSLPVKAFSAFMIEMRIVHGSFLDTALPINVSKQKLICYDRAGQVQC